MRRADGAGMGQPLVAAAPAAMSVSAIATMTPFSGWRGRVRFEQVEERLPAGAVDRRVGILGRVAAGGVDQHRVLGEPPVAQPGAADAGDGALAHLGGQREFQAGVQQRRGLAGAGRPDDRVPGLLVEVAARAARLLQQRERRGQLLARARPLPRPDGVTAGSAGAAATPPSSAARGGGGAQSSSRLTPAQTSSMHERRRPGAAPSLRARAAAARTTRPAAASSAMPTKLSTQRESRNAQRVHRLRRLAGAARLRCAGCCSRPSGVALVAIGSASARPSAREPRGIADAARDDRPAACGARRRELEIGRERDGADRLVVGVADHLDRARARPSAPRRCARAAASKRGCTVALPGREHAAAA